MCGPCSYLAASTLPPPGLTTPPHPRPVRAPGAACACDVCRVLGCRCQLLEHLDLGCNLLGGPIPAELAQLQSLTALFLDNNDFVSVRAELD